MNASIQGIIDHMFKDTVMNAETRALHEELLNNCMEHYEDLIGRGMSEIEAIDAVVDSLKGMKEVIDEYPKKTGSGKEKTADGNKPEIPEIQTVQPAKEEQNEEKPTEYVYTAASVRRIRTDLKNNDLHIGVSPDDRIHVRCEDMEQLVCNLDGSVLSVRIADKAKESIAEASKELSSSEFTLKELFSFLGKAIGTAAFSVTVSRDVYIDLPSSAPSEMDLNAKSGDISIRSSLPELLTVHTMSGDVEVESMGGRTADKVILSTMSGDVEFNGKTNAITMSSMSGDVTARGEFRNAELKSTSGDTRINGTANSIRLNSVSGDVTAEMKNTSVRSIEARTTSGDAEIYLASGTDSVHTTMNTVSGSASCRVPDSGSGALLKISASSVSGDVTIR